MNIQGNTQTIATGDLILASTATLSAGTALDIAFPCPGCKVGDLVVGNLNVLASAYANTIFYNPRVNTDGFVTITGYNVDSGTTLAAGAILSVSILRPENRIISAL